ncbi:putative F420-dependent oxidoreductase, MSMEG_2516 family [Frankia sp. AiPs1]|uniref:TIGR03621 family F420-dependent LLM class oxidoreductase n=1 Tax=Frankia sp. AiPa1 TaxID=573492 RepID=UPI00202AFA9B|nr:TIGR03621 family F420-dependent LLM class oxidoreductase [Frankia sp. AiPa1]MCL9760572.1 TIGR03621 family F420-dependent LLM class oxidoreductase [Frankia sp. AiPa1]
MTERPFRFGVNILDLPGPLEVAALARRAAELGYDVLLVPDHLGLPAPFPTLVAVGAAADLRVGTFVLNAAFHNPALLAREVASTDVLTGGRLELGIGTGYVADEFAMAGLPFGSAGDRVDRLVQVVDQLDEHLADPAAVPRPVQSRVPLLIGGNGDRLLALAARRADIVAFTAAAPDPADPSAFRLLTAEAFAERVAFFERAAGARAAEIERNLLLQVVAPTDDRAARLAAKADQLPYLTPAQLDAAPTLLVGTVEQMATQLRALRARLGISYLTVLHPALEQFAPVIAALRAA